MLMTIKNSKSVKKINKKARSCRFFYFIIQCIVVFSPPIIEITLK